MPTDDSDSLNLCKRFATSNYLDGYVNAPLPVLQDCMETKDEIRRRRLKQVCEKNGGVRQVALDAGLRWETLDQILKGTLLPAKQDNTRAPRAVGDAVARTIEDTYDLGVGWFDWPLDVVDFKRYWALSPEDRVYAQARMMHAIEEREKAALPAATEENNHVRIPLRRTPVKVTGSKKSTSGKR